VRSGETPSAINNAIMPLMRPIERFLLGLWLPAVLLDAQRGFPKSPSPRRWGGLSRQHINQSSSEEA
jgi:hypothetical protein